MTERERAIRQAARKPGQKKIGLLVEGGGMKCAYSAGVLDCFLDEGISFDYAIGVSAGSANIASFLAGQRGRNKRFYTDHIADPEYFGLKNFFKEGDLFNLRYIYATLTNSDGSDPLNFPAILKNPTEFVIVATNARTGRPAYFTKEQMRQDDYRIIMASCALPAACQPVEWENERYYDGGVSDSIPVRRALLDGCDKIVAIMSKPHHFIKQRESHRLAYTALCRRYPAVIQDLNHRHQQYMRSQHFLYRMEQNKRAILFTPEAELSIGTYGMDAGANQKLYELGLQDARDRLTELKSFLQET